MPIARVKQVVKNTTNHIRSRWTNAEANRRHDMAEVMQSQLLTLLGFQPAPVPVPVRVRKF